MTWITEEAQKELDRLRAEQQRISDMYAEARRTVWPTVQRERQAEIITADIMNLRFY